MQIWMNLTGCWKNCKQNQSREPALVHKQLTDAKLTLSLSQAYNRSIFCDSDMSNPDAKRVVRSQIRLVLLAIVVSLLASSGRLDVAISVLLGGLCSIVPSLVYLRIAGNVKHAAPLVIMQAHYKAEATKFILTLLLFGGVLLFFKDLSVPGLFGGFIAALSGYWFGLLIKN